MDDSFEPKIPAEIKHISNEKKLEVIHLLSTESVKVLDDFFERIQRNWKTQLQRVMRLDKVDDYGRILLKSSIKTDESILAKAIRPSILSANAQFSVEHVRDTVRFKAVVYSFRDALRFITAMDGDRLLFARGFSKACVAKLDIDKMRAPKEWG